MRNLKKFLAVLVVVAMIASSFMTAFAADATTTTATAPAISADATACASLGMLTGTGSGVNEAYTASTPARYQAAILLLRLKGLEETAKAFVPTSNFADLDGMSATNKAIIGYLKANPSVGFGGIGGDKFAPMAAMTAQQYYKVMLTALGYTQKDAAGVGDFAYADTFTFAATKGLTKLTATTIFTIDSLASATVEALKGTVAGGTTTLVDTLVAAGKLDAAKVAAAGITPAAKVLDLKTAVSLNSKIIEVTLSTAAVAGDLVASNVTVKDAAAKAIEVSKIEAAPYVTDGKTVLVTLATDATAGTLYTLTSGTKAINFGGIAVDTAKPTISKVEALDYNQIKITFNEAIKLGGTVTVAAQYGTKDALATSTIAYSGKDAITVNTADQTAYTLYGVTIKGFGDLAANTMDDSTTQTFIGIAKDTAVNAISGVTVVDSKTIEVKYTKKIDATTSLDKTKYTAKMTYAPGTALVVTSVTAKADTTDTVVVAFETDSAANTLYALTIAAGVTTLYGVPTTAALVNSFVGTGKDTDAIAAFTPIAKNNTAITVTAGSDPVKDAFDTATTAGQFVVKMKYSPYTVLNVKSVTFDKNIATLVTDAQTNVMYEMTVKAGMKDKAGNATTADKAYTFSGALVAAKITSFTAALDSTGTILTVTFNQSVGASAIDVSHYTIDNGVGYPTKAITDDATVPNAKIVKLTVPKTTDNKLYKLTVKGLENSDLVAMDAAGVSGNFTGKGVPATNPVLQAVQAVDKQTLKLYFDRSVSDSTIDGVLWNSATNDLVPGTLAVKGATTYGTAGSKDLDTYTEYAYKDTSVSDGSVLVVRINLADFVVGNGIANGSMSIDGTDGLFKDAASSVASFSPSATDIAKVGVQSVQSIFANTIRVYFDQPTEITTVANFAKVAKTAAARDALKASFAASTDVVTLSNPIAVDANNTIIDFVTSGAVATGSNYLVVNTNVATGDVHDYTINGNAGYVTITDEDSAATGTQVVREFAGTSTVANNIDSISVVMTDARTMVIYYPEAMNITGTAGTAGLNVILGANYAITNAAGTALMTPASDITATTWTAANNTVTLTFNKDIATSTTGYFLKPAATLANALGTRLVKSNDTVPVQLVRQFAVNGTAAPKVTVSAATYANATGKITITFNQKFTTDTDIDEASTFTNFLAAFDVTAFVGGTSRSLIAGDFTAVDTFLDAADVNDPSGATAWVNKIVLTLDPATSGAFNTAAIGTVKIKVADLVNGINGMGGDIDATVSFGQN